MNNNFASVKALEIELAGEKTRSLPKRIAELLHVDFEEFGKSGRVYDKSMIVAEVPTWEHLETTLTNFKFVELAPGVVMAKYNSTAGGIRANRTSIWVNGNEKWQMLHHQGTACE